MPAHRHTLHRAQLVPGDIETVFGFFEDPRNLEAITPDWLHFEVRNATDVRVRLGTEIEYRLRWQGLPLHWRSRISEYVPGVMFADEMLSGPYRVWYHRHDFQTEPGGVRMLDTVSYELPLGPLGEAVHRALIRRQLESIFDFRRDAVQRIFAGEEGAQPSSSAS